VSPSDETGAAAASARLRKKKSLGVGDRSVATAANVIRIRSLFSQISTTNFRRKNGDFLEKNYAIIFF
jgi:hypothetical protein